MTEEQGRIQRSLPFITSEHHWRQIEEWIADQSDVYPDTAVTLYSVMVEAVPHEEWSEAAQVSRETNRGRIYENAASASEEVLQITLEIANRFAAERYDMDREFLDANL